jgi:hypothetical protein
LPILQAAALIALSGCSDYYYDRRDTVEFYSGDAVATNRIAQTIDPWPRAAADRSIAYNGDRMQSAAERYRTNKTIPLQTTQTNQVYQSAGPGGAPGAPGSP